MDQSRPAGGSEDFLDSPPKDKDDFARWFDNHQAWLGKIALRIVRQEELVDDALQETALNCLRAHAQWKSRRCFKAWVVTILRNVCLRICRDINRFTPFSQLYAEDEARPIESPSKEPDPLDALLKQVSAEIEEAIQTLPPMQQAAIRLWYYENQSYVEIALFLNTSVGSVKKLLYLAKKKLLQKLQGRFRDEGP